MPSGRDARKSAAARAIRHATAAATFAVICAWHWPADVAAATHPTAVSGHHVAEIDIPAGAGTDLVSLPLPSGAWYVTAKAAVRSTDPDAGVYPATCRLVTGADFDFAALSLPQSTTEASRVPVLMTVVHRFTSTGAAVLRCGAHFADSAAVGSISMTAIKAGKLTNGPIGGTQTTTGSGSPRVISAFRDSTLVTPGDTWSPVQQLALPKGRWWVVAKAVVGGASSANVASTVDCRLGADSSQPGVVLPTDAAQVTLTPASLAFGGQRAIAGLQLVAPMGSSGGTVGFECMSIFSEHSTSWLKITAFKLGKVTVRSLDDGAELNLGSGSPRMIHGLSIPPQQISSSTFATVAKLPLPSGKWVLTGKARLLATGGSADLEVECRLVYSLGADEISTVPTGAGDGLVFFSLAENASSSEPAKLRCRRIGAGWTVDIADIRLTALRVSSLTEIALLPQL